MGAALLLLGGIVLVFAVGLAMAQVLLASVSDRTYGFVSLAPAGIGLAGALVLVGALLRIAADSRGRLRGSP